LLLITFSAIAQTNLEIAKSPVKIEMLFSEGKSKALILSYDDGAKQDRALETLMNKYQLIIESSWRVNRACYPKKI
jgi:hypothetical protein